MTSGAEVGCDKHGVTFGICGWCHPPARTPPDSLRLGPALAARFGGHCASCDTGYRPGTTIRHADGLGWVAACCLQEP